MNRALNLVVLLAMLASTPTNFVFAAEEDLPNKSIVQALFLHTEFYPCAEDPPEDDTDLVVRELIRQAFLITAREEFHVPTYDETLGETLPKNAKVLHLYVRERQVGEGLWKVTLYAYDPKKQEKSKQPIWEKEYSFIENRDLLYADMAEKLTISVSEDLVPALRLGGLREEQPVRGPATVVDRDKFEEMLQEVDFVKQFAAVRSAHQAIAAVGESPENLSVLVRGYANLSMLTWHQYNAISYAFSARAWLYAQRLKTLANDDQFSHWNSAYAWALGDRPNHGLADLKYIADHSQHATASEDQPPFWVNLIEPYCNSDREATKQVGEIDERLKPWATRLWFELTRIYQHNQWTYEAGNETITVSPAAFDVYAAMAANDAGHRANSIGALEAPIAFSKHIPKSLDSIPGIPKTIREFLPTNAFKESLLQGVYQDPDTEDPFSGAISFLAKLLRTEGEKTISGDLSWSALAYLLEEEMFIQMVNYFYVDTNWTDPAEGEQVNAVLPLIKNHPYAAFIDVMRYNGTNDKEEISEVVKNLVVKDARRNMVYLGHRLWSFKNSSGEPIGMNTMNRSSLCFTVKGILVHYFYRSDYWFSENWHININRRSVETLKAIAPKSELAARFEIFTNYAPTDKQLKAWDLELTEDATAFSMLGNYYLRQGENDKAANYYQKSNDLIPAYETTKKLANAHLDSNFARWEKTLHRFLEAEDSTPSHSNVHRQLAQGYQHYGLWGKSKPHAIAAVKSNSAIALELVSNTYEALAEWQESERWVRQKSEKYPRYYGHSWYFWCRRTGRGNRFEAQTLAEDYLLNESLIPTRVNQVRLGVYHILEGDLPSALEAYQKAQSFRTTYTCSFMIAQLARKLGDEEMRKQVISDMEKAVEGPDFVGKKVTKVGLAIVELLKSGDCSPEKIRHLDNLLTNYDEDVTRSAFAYFVGTELEALGKSEEADKFWRHAMNIPGRDASYSTLAGNALVERYSTSRQDNEPLGVNDLWPIREIEGFEKK